MASGEKRLDFVILSGSYNRGALLSKITDHLADEVERHKLSAVHVVINDASTQEKAAYKSLEAKHLGVHPYSIVMRWNKSRGGAQGFWATINAGLEIVKQYDFKYFIMIPDDLLPCKDFLKRVSKALDNLRHRDPKIVALNIQPTLLRNYGTIRYLDDGFIAVRAALDALEWKLFQTNGSWKDNFATGSGTGYQMTKRITEAGLLIAPNQDISYLETMDVPSVMFTKRPHPLVWVRSNFIDKEVI